MEPHFYQTAWFWGLCAWAIFLFAFALPGFYTRRLRARARELHQRIEERARDLQQQKAFLRQVIDLIPNAVFIKDLEGRFTLVNKTLAQRFRTTTDAMIGKTAGDFAPNPADVQRFKEHDLELIKTGMEMFIPEERITTGSGETRWIQTFRKPLFDENGLVTQLLGVTVDITQRKRIEEELRLAKEDAEAASRAKSDFLANMSHEIRTPMNGIIGMVELAMTAGGEEQREYLSLVRSSAEALLKILNDILDYSKIEAGKLTLDPVQFGLRELVNSTVKTMAIPALKKNLRVTSTVMPDVPAELVGDSLRLRQVLLNLIGNAIKFTERGEVEVKIEREYEDAGETVLRFSVRDTGIGIPPEKQKKLFHAFEQADSSTTRQYGGTGLGLAISRRIVELMGGSISLQSEPGQGSTFYFTIKFRPAAMDGNLPSDHSVTIVHSPLKAIPAETDRLLRILVADDSPINQRLATVMLNKMGHYVSIASSGLEAVAKWHSRPFDLILMDVQMPEMDGLEATRRIRADEASHATHIPIIAMTAHAMSGDRERCLEAGMDDYITKPVTFKTLADAIHRYSSRFAASASSGT